MCDCVSDSIAATQKIFSNQTGVMHYFGRDELIRAMHLFEWLVIFISRKTITLLLQKLYKYAFLEGVRKIYTKMKRFDLIWCYDDDDVKNEKNIAKCNRIHNFGHDPPSVTACHLPSTMYVDSMRGFSCLFVMGPTSWSEFTPLFTSW